MKTNGVPMSLKTICLFNNNHLKIKIMFYGKRIKKLEQEVAQIASDLAAAQVKVEAMELVVAEMIEDNAVMLLNSDSTIEIAKEAGADERVKRTLEVKDAYEKRLRKFIRQVTSKKKMLTTKIVNDGKDKPEATK